jgi:hypothetical protein
MHRVLSATMPAKAINAESSNELYEKFSNLSAANAQRAVRFIRTSSSRSKDEFKMTA